MPESLDLPVNPQLCGLLTPAATAILSAAGPDAYADLVVRGGGKPDGRRLLSSISPGQVLTRPIVRSDAGEAVLSGLWLWNDWLDDTHTISQDVHSGTGSYWHAIMHRREGDFGNAKYWYAKCAGHPAHARMAELAAPVIAEASTPGGGDVGALTKQVARLARGGGWDAYAWVDVAEAAHRQPGGPLRALAVALQRLEWQALFDETVREATSG